MPRPPNIEPTVHLNVKLRASLRAQLDALLWSEAEQRVPQGAYQEFVTMLLLDHFAMRTLDLAPFTGDFPGERLVRGRPETLGIIVDALKRKGAVDG